ncbi:DUF4153 domain-containing protein [Hymenobacter gummosus]|uniref:DUF4153 domain-containing protein n=1 Tax=Hymenobacter gummosus TaxID=1776032 RepID=A0A3S0H8X1_9BACT|nr:DUF4153 domain-containing protein [Hymenobacter gummosus]RTQ52213.1 DUF4153 domain-containing protein [Hymenobacter gummosus]
MRLPSVQAALATAAAVLRRFPLTLLWAFVLGGAAIRLIHFDSDRIPNNEPAWAFPVLSTAGLGLSLTLALALMAERYRWTAAARWGAQAGGAALLAAWYALAPTEPDLSWGLRLFLLGLGLHLVVAAGPYLSELRRRADTPGFWRYNETLFLRFLLGGVYSGVLFVGCALALVAVKKLFDVDVPEYWFGYLFVTLGTVFNTWFFLAGVPQDFAALEAETGYPKGLKLFTQFVLLPLVVLYLAILYAYLARILVTWTLPQGWVSTLVLALAVAGIFALLLIHPIRHAAENAWIRTFARWFYRALFPLLGLLAVAIGTRVRAYGITEERYFVLVLAGWLLGMAVYFLWRRGQGIIWIPASLAVVAFLSAGGPWGAFAVAQRSQLARLRATATQYGLLTNGRFDARRAAQLPDEARRRLWSGFDFFVDRRETAALQPLFTARLALPDSLRGKPRWWQKEELQEQLERATGITRYGTAEDGTTTVRWHTFQLRNPQVWPLGPGRYWLNGLDMRYGQSGDQQLGTAALPEGTFRLQASRYGRQLQLQQLAADNRWRPRITLQPGRLADSLVAAHSAPGEVEPNKELPAATLTLRGQQGPLRLQVFLRQLNHRQQDTQRVELHYEAQALLEFAQ